MDTVAAGDAGPPRRDRSVAFVFGGGGKWGAVEVGMLRALVRHHVVPDLIVGCSIGAINGAAFAASPNGDGVARLERFWADGASNLVTDVRWRERARSVLGRRPYLYESGGIRTALAALLPSSFDELDVRFQCVAAHIEGAAEHWFDSGPLVDAIVASCAIPGLFPPAMVAGAHYYDGGLVDSIPLDRALLLGATEIYVLQVGRIEAPLEPPSRWHQAPLVAFEIARRHRFMTLRNQLGSDVRVHLLPSGHRLAMDDRRQLAWRRTDDAPHLVDQADRATTAYLAEHPAELSVEHSVEHSAEHPVEHSVEHPAEHPAEHPVEHSADVERRR